MNLSRKKSSLFLLLGSVIFAILFAPVCAPYAIIYITLWAVVFESDIEKNESLQGQPSLLGQ